jgi:hypothetical protein
MTNGAHHKVESVKKPVVTQKQPAPVAKPASPPRQPKGR